jgi:hypothetical protein
MERIRSCGGTVRWGLVVLAFLVVGLAGAAHGSDFEGKPFQMREDFGTEPLSQCVLQYYYYIPCPTYAWFWAWIGPDCGEAVGVFFEIGDVSTGGFADCDPAQCHSLETFRILDWAGYGTVYPGRFTVVFDAYCSDEYGCPTGPSLWTSGPWETHFEWNYVEVEPSLCITSCCMQPGPPPSLPRILITATHTGSEGTYPAWGADNVGTPVQQGCTMHDIGCLPALYPRPTNSHYTTIHSGFYGMNLEYCPPLWICDGHDTTEEGSQYGFIEFAWRIYVGCTGPTAAEAVDWSTIKALYR